MRKLLELQVKEKLKRLTKVKALSKSTVSIETDKLLECKGNTINFA
jgi:hypothetical protein